MTTWTPEHESGVGWVASHPVDAGRRLVFTNAAGDKLLWAVKSEAQAWCDRLNLDAKRLAEATAIREFLESAERLAAVLGRPRSRKLILETWSVMS